MQKRRNKRAATLADVGKAAGVSVMAVSAVINGAKTSSRISDATKERILKAAKKLNYRPNAAARALVDSRMNTIGVVAHIESGELNHYFFNVLGGILSAAALRKQNTTVFSVNDWADEQDKLHTFCDGRIDGAILLAPKFEIGKSIHLPDHTPFVTIHSNEDVPGAINLESDDEIGAYLMTRHLIETGHRRIMHVAGPQEFRGGRRRLDGYQRALKEFNIVPDESLVLMSDFSGENASAQLKEWLRSHDGGSLPDAIFCANDTMAIGCSQVLSELGIRSPDDVSLAGFDDIILCRSTIPPLSTVSQPLEKMGATAVEKLFELIESHGPTSKETRNIVFDTDLVIRGSTSKDRTSIQAKPIPAPGS